MGVDSLSHATHPSESVLNRYSSMNVGKRYGKFCPSDKIKNLCKFQGVPES